MAIKLITLSSDEVDAYKLRFTYQFYSGPVVRENKNKDWPFPVNNQNVTEGHVSSVRIFIPDQERDPSLSAAFQWLSIWSLIKVPDSVNKHELKLLIDDTNPEYKNQMDYLDQAVFKQLPFTKTIAEFDQSKGHVYLFEPEHLRVLEKDMFQLSLGVYQPKYHSSFKRSQI